jgi:GT2 family glycosyltransferase/SAM-dependent methyltransferase
MATPRVSILIPNFNNGRQSAIDGKRDLIGDLCQSLYDTLHDDPTPLEIIAYDDGSTDDSLRTLRDWSNRTWRGGRSFLELIEAEHCGILAKTANVLSRKARGDILARLDGDVRCLTRHWVSKLADVFDSGDIPNLGVVGPKQLRPDLRIHAYGDFILHPHGYTHVAAGMPRHVVKHTMQVDHVMGCFYCCRKRVFDDLGGYDEAFLRGQTIDFGLRSRLRGYAAIAVPHIEFIHLHGTRKDRSTQADTARGINKSLKTFENKWGFSRIAPDLGVVRRKYARTPLLWNRAWFPDQGIDAPQSQKEAIAASFDEGADRPMSLEQSDWSRYINDQAVQQRINFRVAVTLEVIRQTTQPRQAVVLDCGDGLALHLLAMQGVATIGVDRRADRLAIARQCIAARHDPARRLDMTTGRPRLIHQHDPRRTPLPDTSADMVVLFDAIEHHSNPVALLTEARRILAVGKPLVIVSQRKDLTGPDPSAPEQIQQQSHRRRLMWVELLNLLAAVGGFESLTKPGDDPSRDMVLLMKRTAAPAAAVDTSKVA